MGPCTKKVKIIALYLAANAQKVASSGPLNPRSSTQRRSGNRLGPLLGPIGGSFGPSGDHIRASKTNLKPKRERAKNSDLLRVF